MKFGLFYLPTYLPAVRDAQTHYRGMIEQVEFADRVGIDYAWVVEHHFVRHGGLFPANYAFLSYLAGRTKRIRLGAGRCSSSALQSKSRFRYAPSQPPHRKTGTPYLWRNAQRLPANG